MSIITKIFGDPNEKVIKGIQPQINAINALENEYKAFSDEKLKSLKEDFRKEIAELGFKEDLKMMSVVVFKKV